MADSGNSFFDSRHKNYSRRSYVVFPDAVDAMRVYGLLLLLVGTVGICLSQRFVPPPFISNSRDTRLGLLASDLGIDPILGGGGGRFPPNFLVNANIQPQHSGPRGCFCLPANQVCVPSGPIPAGSVKVLGVHTKIVNLSPQSVCPQEQKECCFGSGGPSIVTSSPIGQPLSASDCGASFRIFPGSSSDDEAAFGEFPWMAAILLPNNEYVSGGALVSPNTVVTAAHKVTQPGTLKVRVGDHDLSRVGEVPGFSHQEVGVARVILHPQFNPQTLVNDVAVLKLSSPVRYQRHINSVCLPESTQTFSGQRCYVSGWGQNLNSQFQRVIKKVDLPIVDEFECEERLRKTRLTERFVLDKTSFLCAGGEFGKDSCRGDGGSPLVCQEGSGTWTLVGLVAWGIGCGSQDVPGVYVNVPFYSNFINQHLS